MNFSPFTLVLLLFVVSAPCRLWAVDPKCKGLTPSWAELQEGSLRKVSYISGITGQQRNLEIRGLIGVSSSAVYVDKSGKKVIKIYKPESLLPMKEVLMTRFLQEKKLRVAKVIDFADNVLSMPNGVERIVIKEFIDGESPAIVFPRGNETQNQREFLDVRNEYDELLFDEFLPWLKTQPEYLKYDLKNAAIFRTVHADLKPLNWLFRNDAWILIDP